MITESDWEFVNYLPPKSGGYGFDGYPPKNGAYVIAENKKFPRYVGIGNIHDRMDFHESERETNSNLKRLMANRTNSVVVAYVLCSESDSENVEHTLYNRYSVCYNLYNEREPNGKIIELGLPNFLKWL